MNNIELWAKRWGIQPGAVAELLEGMGVIQTDPPLLPGASEAAVQTAVRLGATADGGRLWRNNVGATTMDDGSFLRFGLANDSPAMNKQFKSSDLIGIRPVLIQPEHVGYSMAFSLLSSIILSIRASKALGSLSCFSPFSSTIV